MNLETIQAVLSAHNLPVADTFTKIDVGFTNTVYSIDDNYILKICTDQDNEAPFKLEAQLYQHFHASLPVPQLIAYDESKSVISSNYMIYHKIPGENLYNVWHTLPEATRKSLVKQLCGMLKVINNTNIADLPAGTSLKPVTSWKGVVVGRIEKYASICEDMGTITGDDVAAINKFVAAYSDCLDEERIALVYWDAHFDNVLVRGGTIVGLLDFERTELASADFALDVVKKMVDFPSKYMSKYAQQFAKDSDYERLMDWYREFYPELFDFKHMNRRLDFYSLAHDLEDLENWPQVRSLKDNVELIISRRW